MKQTHKVLSFPLEPPLRPTASEGLIMRDAHIAAGQKKRRGNAQEENESAGTGVEDVRKTERGGGREGG